MTAPFGLYYLGNDRVMDWLVASLESVRQHGYRGPITVILYNDEITEIAALAARYDFSIWQHDSLRELDRIGMTLDPADVRNVHNFRKLATFWGEYEHFIFSDADVIALMNYQEIGETVRQSDLDLIYFSAPVTHVYQPEFREQMIQEYDAPRYNAGFWAGRRGAFSLDEIAMYAEQARAVRKYFMPGTNDQPFFNYCGDVKRIRRAHFADLKPEFGRHVGAKNPLRIQDGIARRDKPGDASHGRRLVCAHWPGLALNPWMPNRELFLRYRLAPMSFAARLRTRFVWQVVFGPAPLLRQLANKLPGTQQVLKRLYKDGKRTRKLRNMNVSIQEK